MEGEGKRWKEGNIKVRGKYGVKERSGGEIENKNGKEDAMVDGEGWKGKDGEERQREGIESKRNEGGKDGVYE